MSHASSTLAEHHRHCSELFNAARAMVVAQDWAALQLRVGALREAVLEHFRYEEQKLFPLYEEVSGEEGSTEALCAQHDDMRAILWTLGGFSPEEDPPRYCAEFDALQSQFDAHAAEEESRMYPAFERVLGAQLRPQRP